MKVNIAWFYDFFAPEASGNDEFAVAWKWIKIAAITIVAFAIISAIAGILAGSIITAPIHAVVYGIIAFAYIMPCTALAAMKLSGLTPEERQEELELSYGAIKGGIANTWENHKAISIAIIAAIALVIALSAVGFIPAITIAFIPVSTILALGYVVPCTYFAGLEVEDLVQQGRRAMADLPFLGPICEMASPYISQCYDYVAGLLSRRSASEAGLNAGDNLQL